MEELYNLAGNLKRLRKKYHLTQQNVADEIGISCQSYQAYEWGVNVPSLKHFIQLAKFFEVSLDELIQ